MTDRVSEETRGFIMSSVRSKDTWPELAVRKLLHGLGYRYRLHKRELPGSPDIVFQKRKKVIFVHGCFWHGHLCRYGRLPKSKIEYWESKIAKNQERDRMNIHKLGRLGWNVRVIWQCELKNIDSVGKRLIRFLGSARTS